MIPILYEKDEVAFINNGLCRLRDTISAVVYEERNGLFECDFEYPINGANYDLIQLGRIIAVTHDDTGNVQPFDIVSYSKPIDGVVTFHAVHISYRQSYITANGANINSLADAFTLLSNGSPSNPFTYWTDKTSTGYLAAADGVPKSVRQMLGGVEGSILDAYGGEYEWDRFTVKLWAARGRFRDFSIRYGVNMLDYQDDTDTSGTYSACVPYWTDGTDVVVGSRQLSDGNTITGRGETVPLDVSEKFESKPTVAQVEAAAVSMMKERNPFIPAQTIKVSFARLQDLGEYASYENLLQCGLCDTIRVIFPEFNGSGNFKIAKTTWNVLANRYDEMELGDLSTSLAEALGITNGLEGGSENIKRGWAYVNSITSTAITTVNSPIKIPITSLNSTDGSFAYDSDSKGIVCNRTGDYMLTCSLAANPATDGDLMGLQIYKNGSSVVGPDYERVGGNYDTVKLSATHISLISGDVLTIYGRNNTAARGTYTNCRFAIWEV